VFFNSNANAQCNQTLYLYDSYGDGWNGGSINVYVGGAYVGNYTIGSGSSATYTFSATNGQAISISFSAGGWAYECSYAVVSGTGSTLVSGWQPYYSGTWNGTAACSAPSYCTPYTNYTCCMGISQVIFNTINNSSGNTNYIYQNFTNLSTNVEAGSTTNLFIAGWWYEQYATVWVDLNDNLVFETSERLATGVYMGYNCNIGITIPNGTSLGNHRMRIRTQYYYDGVQYDPCATTNYGETEDYTINVIAPCVNNPGAVSVPAAICVGTATSISNVTAATGSLGSANYFFYYRGGPSNVPWQMYNGPTTNSSSSLPGAVINTPGTWYIARNSDFGCGQANNATTLDLQIIVNSASTAGTISGTQTLCPSGTSALTTSGNAGGTWTSSNVAVATVNSSTGLVTAIGSGSATITYTVSNAQCGNVSANYNINVNSPTAPTASGTTISCGQTATLSASGAPSGGSYVWYSDGAGTNQVGSGSSFTTPSLSANATYYAGSSVSGGSPSCNTSSLANILSSLTSNQSTISAAVTNGYNFTMDGGVNGPNINDGGNDMYDGGNFISTNFATNFNYSDGVVTSSGAFGSGSSYFTRKINNMWALTANMNNVSNFTISGNNGADGGGSVNGTTLTTTVGCQQYILLLKRVWNAGDPSINQMVIIPSTPGVTQTWSTNTDDSFHQVSGLNGVTRMYYLLYASANGSYLDDNAAINIATTFLNQVSATISVPNECISSLTPVSVTVNPLSGPTVSGTTQLCVSGSTTLTATGTGNTIEWYADAAGTQLISTGTTLNTPVLTANTTYYVREIVSNSGSQTFNYSGSIQNFTVPSGVTSLTGEARGAQGGASGSNPGGLGARIQGTVNVTSGQVLQILVGEQGVAGTQGGGGGGTFLVSPSNSPLIIAGGGGGAHYDTYSAMSTNAHGAIGNNGNNGIQGISGNVSGTGGTLGQGGSTGVTYSADGSGGGGLLTNGQDGSPATGGRAFVNGGAGGSGAGTGGRGGFGGGGGGDWSSWTGGGGGGGYSGGGGGDYFGCGGGGGSFNAGSNQTNTAGFQSGNGQIVVSWSGTGCTSTLVPVTVTINAAPTVTATASSISPCLGQTVTLTGGGATDYSWSNGVNTAAQSLIPASTTTYTVTGTTSGCTGVAQVTVTLPTAGSSLSGNSEDATCTVNQDGWIHFYHSSGRLIGSINSQGQNLGNVTMTSYVDGTNALIPACTNPSSSTSTSVLQRHWVITPSIQPSSPVLVRLPHTLTEFNSLSSAASTNPNTNDDILTPQDLDLTKYSNGSEANVNSSALDNCGVGTSTFHQQTQYDNTNTYSAVQDKFAEFSISSFSEFWLHGSATSSPLPVELISFQANCAEDGKVEVTWATASEHNSSDFTVEKSRDGINWSVLATLAGAGNSTQVINYSVADNTAAEGINYYRLTQTDFDGASETFNIASANCSESDVLNTINVYPNPSTGDFYIDFTSVDILGTSAISITDARGSEIYTQSVMVEKGSNVFHIDNMEAAPGIYYIKVSNGANTSNIVKHSLR
jgi:hypothetical protein